jgi:hypothetical protein
MKLVHHHSSATIHFHHYARHRHDEESEQDGSSPSQTRISSETHKGEVADSPPEEIKGGAYNLEKDLSTENVPSPESAEKV